MFGLLACNNIMYNSTIIERIKRHDTTNHLCSIHSMYLDFKEIGYDWITEPKGVNFSYCKGECTLQSFSDSSIIYGKMVTDYLSNSGVSLCCSAKKRKDLTIKYSSGRTSKKVTIKNFLPASCGSDVDNNYIFSIMTLICEL
ncbi:SWPV1-201 [Shearwaterpox virus]|uniref:SWPV1-201 n=1 Tax=Shearwaterpox virus TaxID=1974596 RepID=A0A1V0S826_CNPV|nr:SWPV1-201 [Shearwaterpox virus]